MCRSRTPADLSADDRYQLDVVSLERRLFGAGAESPGEASLLAAARSFTQSTRHPEASVVALTCSPTDPPPQPLNMRRGMAALSISMTIRPVDCLKPGARMGLSSPRGDPVAT